MVWCNVGTEARAGPDPAHVSSHMWGSHPLAPACRVAVIARGAVTGDIPSTVPGTPEECKKL